MKYVMRGVPRKRRSFADIAGTWRDEQGVQSALAAQDQIDADYHAAGRKVGRTARPIR